MIRYAPRNPSTRLGRRFLKPLPVDMEPVAVAITLPDFGVASADQLVFDAMTVSLAMPDFASTGVGVTDFDTLAIAVTMPDFGVVEQAVTLFDPMVVAVTLPDFAVLDQGVIQFEPIAVSLTMPDFADVAAGVTPFEPIAVSISMPDFTEIEATVTPFDPIAVSVSMPDFIVLGQAVTTFDPMAVSVTLPDFASLGTFITGFDPLAVAVTMPDFGVLAAGVTTFDAMTVSVALPDFTVVAPVAAITIDSIGPQQSSGDVPVSYSIDMNDATVEAVLFLATDPDPAAADFNTGATTGYIDLGQVSLTTAGSGITLTGPDDLLGNYKLAYLPTGGGDADVAVSASFALDSTATVISPSAFVTGSGSGEVDWSFTPDEAGAYRVSIYADGATPSNADIAAGTGAVATVTGSGIAATGESGTLTGAASTAYDGYIYYLDSFGNDVIVGPVDVTSAAGDVTAPTLSSPVDNADGGTAATGSVDTNEGNGTLYWVVTQSATAPSAAQVKAGNDHTGSAADDSGSQSVSGTGTQNLSPAPSGLTSETSYFIHFMHEDAATNQSSIASGDGFTTADVTAPTLSSTAPADNATDIAVDAVIDLVFSETVTLETGNIVLRENSAGFADLETFNVATGSGDNGGTVALATTSVTNDTVRITPGADLANNVEHAVRVAATAIDDVAGNSFAGIADDTTVSFTTVASSGGGVFSDDFAGYADGTALDSTSSYNRISPFYNLVKQAGPVVQTNGPNDFEETDVEAVAVLNANHYVETVVRWNSLANVDARLVLASDGTDYVFINMRGDGSVFIETTVSGLLDTSLTFSPTTAADMTLRARIDQTTDEIEVFVDAVSLGTVTNAGFSVGGNKAGMGIYMGQPTTAADLQIKSIEVGNS